MTDSPITVLVIEDDKLLLGAIVTKLQRSGFNATPATSGADALSYLETSTKIPDAIWLDYYLKDMNGDEFMKAVKGHPRWSQIPVVVVSNSASEAKIKTMMDLGVKKYVIKAQSRLDEIVAEIVALTKRDASPSPRKILVVEDEPAQAQALSVKLKNENFAVTIAKDGAEGLAQFTPDTSLILLDLIMPRMEGLEMLDKLRSEHPHLPPVIILTNKELFNEPKDVAKVLYKSTNSLDQVVAAIKEELRV